MRYLLGSKILKLDNSRDHDYIVVSEGEEYRREWLENGEDILYIGEITLKNKLEFKDIDSLISNNTPSNRQLLNRMLYNYQYDKDIMPEEFCITYTLLDYREELTKLLKHIKEKKLFNFNKRIKINNQFCSKIVYHIAYNIFILQNNSPILTQEQKEIIQKIHDFKMPVEYVDVLNEMIDNL